MKEKKPYDRSTEETDDDEDQIEEEDGEQEEDNVFDDIFNFEEEEEEITSTTTERLGNPQSGKHRKKNKNKLSDLEGNSTVVEEQSENRRNNTDSDGIEQIAGKIPKRRKSKPVSKDSDVNSLSKHKHRHKVFIGTEGVVIPTSSPGLPNTTPNGKDWVSKSTFYNGFNQNYRSKICRKEC